MADTALYFHRFNKAWEHAGGISVNLAGLWIWILSDQLDPKPDKNISIARIRIQQNKGEQDYPM